jgi:hypothetical protein
LVLGVKTLAYGEAKYMKLFMFGYIKEVLKMGFPSFFNELIFLEDAFMGSKVEGRDDGTIKNYSAVSVSTFFALRNYVLSCAWTTSNSMEFIVKNMRLNSAELAQKYETETGKQKAEATFRVQRASASKTLFSLFGTGFSEALITDNRNEVMKLKDYITFFTEGSKHVNDLFNCYILERVRNLPEIKDTYSVDECSKELIVLSKFTTEYFEAQFVGLDMDKVKYIYNILSSSFLIGTYNKSFNKNKANMLSVIKKYACVQSSYKVREEDGVSDTVPNLLSRIDKLEKENQQKAALVTDMKARFKSDLAKEVDRRLQEERLMSQELKETNEDFDLFDNVKGCFETEQY